MQQIWSKSAIFLFCNPNQAELQEVVGMGEGDDDAVPVSSPSPAETPESLPSQVQ